MQSNEIKSESTNYSQYFFKTKSIFEKLIMPSISKNVDRSNQKDTIALNKITWYDDKLDLDKPFQYRFTKMLIMCVEFGIETDEVWEALKDMFPFQTHKIEELECRKISTSEFKKIVNYDN